MTPTTTTTTTTGGVVLFVGIIALGMMLFIMPNIITIKSVSSFSTTAPFSSRNNKSSALVGSKLFQSSTSATTTDATKKTRPLMEPPQVDGNNMSQRMLRRLRRQRENNNYENNDKNTDGDEKNNQNNDTAAGGSGAGGGVPIIPDPLVPYDSVRSVRLITVDEEDEAETSSSSSSSTTTITKSVRVEIGLDNSDSTTTSTSTTGVGLSRKIIDPRQLHQTSDFELWMTLRKQVVDVSASQLSIVLGTNFFTSRHQLLEEKITTNKQKQKQPMEDQQGDLILIGKKNNDDTSTPTMSKSNSKACAWGIKMEPIAFAQYKNIMESTTTNTSTNTNTNTNTNDDDDENENDNAYKNNNNNFVEETGMYLLTHTDPVTKKTFTFGASPDGLVTEYNTTTTDTTQSNVGLLEIKSLWGRRHKETLPQFDQCPNRFYDQIQGQLAVCNKEWCDLMLFIPPSGATSSSSSRSSSKKGRKGKSKKKRMKQQRKAEAAGVVQQRKTKGKNYCILRVKRNRKYWDETVLPALLQFCQEVDSGVIATATTPPATE